MLPFVKDLLGFKNLNKQRYDDYADRANYVYTSMILLILGLLVTTKEQFGSPIKCWVPYEFRLAWEQYVENYCYISNTYYLPYNATIPRDVKERDFLKIGYYQWVPLILLAQGLLFYLPHLLWRATQGFSSLNLKTIMQIASKSETVDKEEDREKNLSTLCSYCSDALQIQSKFRCSFCWTFLYFLIKILFAANAFGQLYLLNKFFSSPTGPGGSYRSSNFWGPRMIDDIINGKDWKQSGFFPRVTLCDVPLRQLNNIQIQMHTVECVLMINMLNEKIYIFLWFWFLFISLYTIANLVFFLLSHMVVCSRHKKVKRFLKIGAYQRCLRMKNVEQLQQIGRRNEVVDSKRLTSVNDTLRRLDVDSIDSKILNKFTERFLGADGVLLIQFVSNQCGEILASALVYRLFNKFLQLELERRFTTRELTIVEENPSTTIDQPPTISNLSRLFENDRKKFNSIGGSRGGGFVEINSLLDPSLNIG